MKLYNDIKDLEFIISGLKKGLNYSKDKKMDATRINKLVDVRNNYYNILYNKFYFDSLDALILSNVLLRLRLNNAKPNHTNIEFYFKEVFENIKNGSSFKYAEIEDRIITELRTKDIKNGKKENLLNEYPKEKINKAIRNILDTLKKDMVWNLKK